MTRNGRPPEANAQQKGSETVEGIVTNEARAWMRAADTAGVELPVDITEALANVERLEAEIAALPQVEKVPGTAELAAKGLTLERAAEENARLAAEMAGRKEKQDAARPAVALARGDLSRLVAEQRDNIVIGVRPLLTSIIDEARPLAETLAPYAPKYDPGAIVRNATPKHLKAYQESAELEIKFGSIMAAWRSSFGTSNMPCNSASAPANFDVRWVDQVHRYFDAPELVQNPRLNGTQMDERGRLTNIQPTVLGVACESPEAGFRLATLWELKDAYDSASKAAFEAARRERRYGVRSI